MKVTLVSHASLIVETADCRIWTDPWLFGKAFMEAWSLYPEANWRDELYDDIDYLWISHEHPDHFHIPTLRKMPQSFKDRVTVLLQRTNSDKLPNAFRKMLGFKNVELVKHREIVQLTPGTRIHTCQVGVLPDASLAVMSDGYTLLNINDCEVNTRDCMLFVQDLGKINLVLNQFSPAGYRGQYDWKTQLAKNADIVRRNVIQNHKDLNADVTIPYASFVYFSDQDNRHVNAFMNTPMKVRETMTAEGLQTAILYPGDTYDSTAVHDSAPALAKFRKQYACLDDLPYRKPTLVPWNLLEETFRKRFRQLHEKHPKWLLRRLRPLNVRVTDLEVTARICLWDGTFETTEAAPDLLMGSEAFHHAFANTWGVATISVAAKLLVKSGWDTWKWYKIVTTMNNAEFYLKPRYLLSKANLEFVRARSSGGLNQLMYKWRRMT